MKEAQVPEEEDEAIHKLLPTDKADHLCQLWPCGESDKVVPNVTDRQHAQRIIGSVCNSYLVHDFMHSFSCFMKTEGLV